jgi:hypothetical protein
MPAIPDCSALVQYSWGETLECIDPYYFASLGIALSLTLSVLGAAW